MKGMYLTLVPFFVVFLPLSTQLPFETAELWLCHVPANCPLPRVLGEFKVFVFFPFFFAVMAHESQWLERKKHCLSIVRLFLPSHSKLPSSASWDTSAFSLSVPVRSSSPLTHSFCSLTFFAVFQQVSFHLKAGHSLSSGTFTDDPPSLRCV